MGGADLVQEFADGEDLADGTDEELVSGFGIDERLAGVEVDDAEAPGCAFVGGLVEDGFDVGGEGWSGRVVCRAAADGGDQER